MPKKTGASKWFVPKATFVNDNRKKEIFKNKEDTKHGNPNRIKLELTHLL